MSTNALSLVSMLMRVPATYHAPTRSTSSVAQLEHLAQLHTRQFERGLARYRAAIQGYGWVPTKLIECRLGLPVTAGNSFLRKLKALGYIVSRPAGGGEKYLPSQGWEWHWVEGE